MRQRSNRIRSFALLIGFVGAMAVGVLLALAGDSAVVPVAAAPEKQDTSIINFAATTASVVEPDAGETRQVELEVRINPAPDGEAEISYSTANGSATSGVDYEATTGTLVFPSGSNASQTIEVTIFGNDSYDQNRTFVVFLTNAQNAEAGVPASVTVTIVENDSPPATNTPTPTPGDTVFIDNYEPNNHFDTAYETAANADPLTRITLWPVGDEDYFKFYAQKGSYYEVSTTDITAGLNPLLRVYNPDGGKIGESSRTSSTNPDAVVGFTASQDGFYFAEAINENPTDSTARTYSLEVDLLEPPTPTPTATLIGVPDVCEDNNTLDTACLIGPGEVKAQMNFIPPSGSGVDTDYYTMPIKPGILYTCQTENLSAVNDTNIIFLNGSGGDFNPQLGNDDRAPGDKSSELSYFSTYEGNLTIVVGPVNPPTYANSPQYTYDLVCSSTVATPTPPPVPTATTAPIPPSGGGTGGSGGGVFNTPTPMATLLPTPTPIDIDSLIPTPQPPPLVDFEPLPTSTPAGGGVQTTTVSLTAYYDSNYNYTPELTEGIMDVEVALYDGVSDALLAFGYTNEAGMVLFESVVSTSGSVRVVVPFLNYSQVVTGASANILLRVDPRPLPAGVP